MLKLLFNATKQPYSVFSSACKIYNIVKNKTKRTWLWLSHNSPKNQHTKRDNKPIKNEHSWKAKGQTKYFARWRANILDLEWCRSEIFLLFQTWIPNMNRHNCLELRWKKTKKKQQKPQIYWKAGSFSAQCW